MEISLSNGKVAIVDSDDYEQLSKFKWSCSPDGYAFRNMHVPEGRKRVYMHRLVAHTEPVMMTDHINGNTLDNRKENLRCCTNRENLLNQKKRAGSTSKYKGVSWRKDRSKWLSAIYIDGKQVKIGTFGTEEEAAKAYDAEAVKRGEFARLNFPG